MLASCRFESGHRHQKPVPFWGTGFGVGGPLQETEKSRAPVEACFNGRRKKNRNRVGEAARSFVGSHYDFSDVVRPPAPKTRPLLGDGFWRRALFDVRILQTPGGTILYFAHEQLEMLTVDKDTLHEKQKLAIVIADRIYNGKWYSALTDALVAFGESDYDQAQAAGFINLWGMPTKVEALLGDATEVYRGSFEY